MRDFHEQTYYELLEIRANASQEEILKAYNRARSTYGNNSPALYSLFNKEEAQDLLKLIDEAYTVLSNPFKRKQYDKDATQYHANKDLAPPVKEEQDFAIPSASDLNIDSGEVPPEPPAQKVASPDMTTDAPPVEAGLGATLFSRYKIDPEIEREIKTTEAYSGSMLHKIRLYKNVTLDQISEMTKVSRSYLMAVENDNYTSLPAAVFTRGFLVQIAKILNLDSNKVASSYLKLMKEAAKK